MSYLSLQRKLLEKFLILDLTKSYGYDSIVLRRHLEDEKSFVATLRDMAVFTVKEFAKQKDIQLNITGSRLTKHKVTVIIDSELSQEQLNDFVIKNTWRVRFLGNLYHFAKGYNTDADTAISEFFFELWHKDRDIFSRNVYDAINQTMIEFVKSDTVNVHAQYRGVVLAVPKDIFFGNRYNVIEYFEKSEQQGLIRMDEPTPDNTEVTCVSYD